jgi:hypothetical protein
LNIFNIIIHFVNFKYENIIYLIGLPELSKYNKFGIDQYIILYFLFKEFGIIINNLEYFVLDNISNNNIIFKKFIKKIKIIFKYLINDKIYS